MKHSKDKSRIREKNKHRKYNGESSPYRDWLDRQGEEHEDFEPAIANPDVLEESDGLYYFKSDLNEEQMAIVIEAIPLLTEKQKQVLSYVGLEGKTLENCGAMMGISRGNVLDLLNRARKTIKAQAKRRKK